MPLWANLRTGLIGHYPMEGNADDLGPNAYHGTPNGSPTFGAGRFGQGMQFDGVDDHVDVAGTANNLPSGSAPRTLSVWAYPTNTGSHGTLVSMGGSGASQRFSIHIQSGGQILMWGSSDDFNSGSNIPQDTWTHLTMTYTGTDITLYVNGTFQSNIFNNTLNTSAPETLQIGNDLGLGRYAGSMDEVRVYDRALSAAEVMELYDFNPELASITSKAEDATVDEPYLYTPMAFSPGANTLTWSVNGALPGWLSLQSKTGGNFINAAGTNSNGSAGDGGSANLATIGEAWGIDFDDAGNLYILDSTRIRKVDARTNIITTVAGDGTGTYSGDGGLATSAGFQAYGFAVDGGGNIYLSEWSDYRIRKVDAATGNIDTIAGNGTDSSTGDGCPASVATVNRAYGLEVGPDGSLYFANSDTTTIRKIDPSGNISTIAGTGVNNFSGDGGPATSAELQDLRDLRYHRGKLYVTTGTRIRSIDLNTGIIETFAGTASGTPSGDGGSISSASFGSPWGIEFGPEGRYAYE